MMSSLPYQIALVEDDDDLRDSIVDFLCIKGYAAWGVGSAEAFYSRLSIEAVDLLIADIGLPGDDGFAVTRYVQHLGLPVIILSGRNTSMDRVGGLEAGANRYLVKPIDLVELVANIEAVRRAVAPVVTVVPIVAFDVSGRWRLDTTNWRLRAPNGRVLSLTAKEFVLLKLLVDAGPVPVDKHHLAASIWRGSSDPHRVDVLMTRLRSKAQQNLEQPLPVKSVPALGLVLTVPCDSVTA
jgi:DNA-binding response OmpR family regulator